jgi:hypothetical protein
VAPGHEKIIIRTDIMCAPTTPSASELIDTMPRRFERRPMICTSATDQKAYALYREAECLECEGNPLRAAQLYQQVLNAATRYSLPSK